MKRLLFGAPSTAERLLDTCARTVGAYLAAQGMFLCCLYPSLCHKGGAISSRIRQCGTLRMRNILFSDALN